MDTHKNPNLAAQQPSSPSQDLKRTHHQINHTRSFQKKTHEEFIKNIVLGQVESDSNDHEIEKTSSFSKLAAGGAIGDVKRNITAGVAQEPPLAAAAAKMVVVEENGRERLKRHRIEMAGRVWIPEMWGQEDLLKDWIDCTVFDSSLGNSSIMSARAALVEEGRSTVRIENRC